MKNIDVIIVRILPIILYVMMGVEIVLITQGYNPDNFYYLHSNSFIYAASMFFISLANKRYHCTYNRICYVVLCVVPILNYLDAEFDISPDTQFGFILIAIIYIAGLVLTAWLAIRHFVKALKRKRNARP